MLDSDNHGEWTEIQIRYKDNYRFVLDRDDLKKIKAYEDVIDAISKAKSLANRVKDL